MNRQAKIAAWIECEDCAGTGEVIEFRRYAGEAIAGEPYSSWCGNCDGEGGWEDLHAEAMGSAVRL